MPDTVTDTHSRDHILYHSIFESAPIGILMIKPDGALVQANQHFCSLLGYSPAMISGLNDCELTHPADRELVRGIYRQLLEGQSEEFVFRKRYLGRGGQCLWVQVRIRRMPLHFMLLVQDSDEQQASEEKSLGRLLRLYNALSRTHEAADLAKNRKMLLEKTCEIVMQSGDFVLAWIGLLNESTQQIESVAVRGQAQDYPQQITVSAEDSPAGSGPSGLAVRTGKSQVSHDIATDPRMTPWQEQALRQGFRSSAAFPLFSRDRVVGCVNLYAAESGLFDEQEVRVLEELTTSISFAYDKLEQEEKRRQAEEIFQRINEYMQDTLWILDMNLRTTFISPSVEKIRGYSLDELQAQPFEKQMTPDSYRRFLNFLSRGVSQENLKQRKEKLSEMLELEFTRKDGSTFWGEIQITLMRDGQGNPSGLLCVGRDLSERKRLEQARVRLSEQMQKTQRIEMVGRLAGGLAHEFNNLLVPILGYSELALGQLPAGEKLHDDLEQIYQAAERALGLTRQLLAFGSKPRPELQAADLNAAIRGVEKILRSLANDNVEIHYRLSPDLVPGYFDTILIQQVILSLVLNACDTMPQGGELILATSLEETLDGRVLRLMVRDSCGAVETPAADHDKTASMAAILEMVRLHRGRINMQHLPGQGSEVTIDLLTAEPAEMPVLPALPQGHETILVVENDKLVRESLQAILLASGYRVLLAASSEEAMQLVDRHPETIQLLITDVIMPKRGGKELHQTIACRIPGVKILFISGHRDDILARQGLLESGSHFLAKPFSRHSLGAKIREVLEQPPAAKA
jgi:PAS domain S-box-containing protein